MRFEDVVSAFEASLRHPGDTPEFTHGRRGRPDGKRFQVYRNNVAAGLIGAIEGRFPVVRRLVGDDFFRGLAGAYVAERKPSCAVLARYGADFPDFVAAFAPARTVPYLGDVARLENAWIDAYNASEATALSPSALAEFDPETFAELTFDFHPSARLLAFEHPAASIWAAHQGEGEPRPIADWAAEQALIVRPDADVFVRILPIAGWRFACALQAGASLGEAAAILMEAGEDVGHHLVRLMETGAVRGISRPSL